MVDVWPTADVTELCLHSLPAQGLETEMSAAPTDSQSCESFVVHAITYAFTLLYCLL